MTSPQKVDIFDTDVKKVRALIPDIEPVPNPNQPYADPEYMFADLHLQAFLDINNQNIRLAAADALEALGTSEAYIAKVIKTEDLQTDGAKMMGQFLARSRWLRQVASMEANDDPDGFDIVEYAVPAANQYYAMGS